MPHVMDTSLPSFWKKSELSDATADTQKDRHEKVKQTQGTVYIRYYTVIKGHKTCQKYVRCHRTS